MTGLDNGWEQKGGAGSSTPSRLGAALGSVLFLLASCLQRDFQNFL